jgi:FixJ family two-component response regulator
MTLQTEGPALSVSAESPHADVTTGMSVVVVDDDPFFRRSLERLLRVLGFRVAGFESAESYLADGRGLEPACLILDIHLGGMSGLELYDALVAMDDARPTVFVSAVEDPELEGRIRGLRSATFLHKPCEPTLLAAKIRELAAAH